MPGYRGKGYDLGRRVAFAATLRVVEDTRVKNKKEVFKPTRLEMIPFWKKRIGDIMRVIPGIFIGVNGLE